MARNNLRADMIDWVVPHQANRRIIETTAERLGLPMDKVMFTIHKYGNTTTPTIPLCLWDYEDKLKPGDRLVLAAFGGGFTWGGAYVTWAYDGANSAEAQRPRTDERRRVRSDEQASRRHCRPRHGAQAASAKPGRARRPRRDRGLLHAKSRRGARPLPRRTSIRLSDSLDQVLADRSIDIVFLLTPPTTHLEQVERCAAAGKHVLLEKPIDVTSERAAKGGCRHGKGGAQVRHHAAASVSRRLAQVARGGQGRRTRRVWSQARPRSAGGGRRNISRSPAAA